MTSEPVLMVDDLRVTFTRRGSPDARAVDGVSFEVRAGQVVGLVGESGCGKSVTSLAVLGLLPNRGVRVSGRILLAGHDVRTMSQAQLRAIRGKQAAMVFQDPMSSLNPVVPIGLQVSEVLTRHEGLNRRDAQNESIRLLDRVGIPDARRRTHEYPHQLSGGMRQRALIAMALACKPRLLIADEPTTALDVTIQAQVLELLRELVSGSGTAMVLITHDLGVVAGMCDTVNVMYAGRVVERAGRGELFARPRHQYTGGLLASIPRLDSARDLPLVPIRGSASDTIPWDVGCAFAPRCRAADDDCLVADLALDVDAVVASHPARCVHPVGTTATGVPGEPAEVVAP